MVRRHAGDTIVAIWNYFICWLILSISYSVNAKEAMPSIIRTKKGFVPHPTWFPPPPPRPPHREFVLLLMNTEINKHIKCIDLWYWIGIKDKQTIDSYLYILPFLTVTVEFSQNAYAVNENVSAVDVEVRMTGATDINVVVRFVDPRIMVYQYIKYSLIILTQKHYCRSKLYSRCMWPRTQHSVTARLSVHLTDCYRFFKIFLLSVAFPQWTRQHILDMIS